MRRTPSCVAIALSSALLLPRPAAAGDKQKDETRKVLLPLGLIADVAGTAGLGYELWTGETNLAVSGLSVTLLPPVIAYGAVLIQEDTSDVAMWGVTLVAGALFTKAMVDLIANNRVTDHPVKKDVGGPHITVLPHLGPDRQAVTVALRF